VEAEEAKALPALEEDKIALQDLQM